MRPDDSTDRRRLFRRHEHLAHKDEIQERVFQIEEGWSSRYCVLPDGRRQITAIYLPGDYCEPQWLLSGKADLPIIALTPVKAQVLPLAGVHTRPGDRVMKLLGAVLEGHVRQTSWIVNLGRKSALERVSDLLAELFGRLQNVGLVADNRCNLPLTQQDIADIVGLTPVHVNRVLGELRSRGLLRFSGKSLHLPDPQALGVPPRAQPSAPAPGQEAGPAATPQPAGATWAEGKRVAA